MEGLSKRWLVHLFIYVKGFYWFIILKSTIIKAKQLCLRAYCDFIILIHCKIYRHSILQGCLLYNLKWFDTMIRFL